MLYHFLFPLADEYTIFNLFKYLTFRTGGAVLTALVISFVIGPSMIRWLRGQQANGQPIRNDGPETHLAKRGTPTMGGLMILVALIISTLLWADINIYSSIFRFGYRIIRICYLVSEAIFSEIICIGSIFNRPLNKITRSTQNGCLKALIWLLTHH